ncbi:MAG: SH3 domain-containing protein [Stappiaceae bacterium]
MTLRIFIFCLIAILPAVAHADSQTVKRGYYRVVDVAADDTLNIRSGPGTNEATIHSLKNGTIVRSTGISTKVGNTEWLQVNAQESMGWASLRFLKWTEPKTFSGTDVPIAGICSGTEPNWYVRWKYNTLFVWTGLGSPAEPDITVPLSQAATAEGFTRPGFLYAQSPKVSLRLVHQPGVTCQAQPVDTDMEVGVLFLSTPEGEKLLNGCCRAEEPAFE